MAMLSKGNHSKKTVSSITCLLRSEKVQILKSPEETDIQECISLLRSLARLQVEPLPLAGAVESKF